MLYVTTIQENSSKDKIHQKEKHKTKRFLISQENKMNDSIKAYCKAINKNDYVLIFSIIDHFVLKKTKKEI